MEHLLPLENMVTWEVGENVHLRANSGMDKVDNVWIKSYN